MRIERTGACIFAFGIQTIKALTLSSPFTGSTLTAGLTFSVSWMWDGLPDPTNDGYCDILLVRDIGAMSVALTLDKGVSPLGLFTSATIPLGTPSGQYYIQLKVTSGNEKSAINGPYNVVGGSSSTTSGITAINSVNVTGSLPPDSSPTAAGIISTPSPNTDAQTSTDDYSSSHSYAPPAGLIAGLVVAGVVFLCFFIFTVLVWCRRIRFYKAIAANLEREIQEYERPSLTQYLANGNKKYASQSCMNGYQRSPYGASPMHTPYKCTVGTEFSSMQTNESQTQYSSSSGPTFPSISHSPSSMPAPVPYHRHQENDRYQQPSSNTNISSTGIQNNFNRTQISTKYPSPNSKDSTALLDLPHTDNSRERHVPHLVEGVYNSPPHTSDPASLEPPK